MQLHTTHQTQQRSFLHGSKPLRSKQIVINSNEFLIRPFGPDYIYLPQYPEVKSILGKVYKTFDLFAFYFEFRW